MKKLFAWVLLLTLMLGLFAGCKKTETPTEPTVGDYVTAQAAMEYLKALYKNTEEATPTPRDYERYGVIRVGGEPFEVVWTVDLGEDMIKVVVGDDEMVTIDINELCQTDTPYVLTATITDKGGNSVSHSWNYILPKAMDVGQVLKDAYALADGESLPYEVTLTGKLIEINTMYNSEYQNITVTMVVEGYEEYPIECYRLKGDGVDQLAVGNIITVTGTLKNYKGTIEFDSGCILESWEKGDAVDAPEDPLEIVKAAYALADGESLPYVATLTGKVTEIDTPYDPDYSNISVVMVVEGAEGQPITCYRLKGTGVDQIAVDDIITVMGIIKNYKGTIEFDSGCQLLDRISGGREAEKPSTDPAKIFADAKKLKSGEHLNYYATLTGKVTDIESPYDSEYSNITVVMSVKGYESTPITCYRLKGTGVEKIARGDTITVKGIIENYKGKLEFGSGCTMLDRVSGGGVAKPETSNVKTIMTDAAKLSSGQHLDYYSTLTGKVIDIESPYDKEYGNITVVMEVKGYENMPITCYRLKSGDVYSVAKIARGDTITVRGVLENYNGKLEYGSGCTLQKRVSGGGTVKPETSNVKTIMADAAKLESGEHLDYYATLTGKVTEIESPYDKEYGNITVVMEVKGYEDSPITCYRLKSGDVYSVAKIARGDTITVRGVLENYNGKLEFGSGCTLQKRVSGGGTAKAESSDAKTILADAAKLAQGDKLDYYANLTGKVTEIDTPYDKEYGNISVYMAVTVEGKTTTMLCYRLKSGDVYSAAKIAVGDTITVRGVIENYKGDVQFGSGSTLQKRVSGGGVAKPETSDVKTIMTDAKALAADDKLDYYSTLTGKVVEIETPYDQNYDNITVVMEVEGYEADPITCYRLKSGKADASKIAVGDTITVRGVLENYKGEKLEYGSGCTLQKRVSGGGVAKPETDDQAAILADAAELEANEHLDYYSSLTGKVIDIETPYDKVYGNITVVIELNDSAKTQITCYRMKSGAADASLVARGDTITVRGVLERYVNSSGSEDKLEYGSGCTLEKRISGGGTAKPETDDQATILADAANLASGDHLDYYATLTGKVTSVDSPYDTGYKNITVTIEVNGTKIQCYCMKSGAADASEVRAGDTITVRGVLENYNGKLEFGTGCTLEALVPGNNPGDNMTAEEIVDAAYALQSGETLEGQYTLTGVISSVDEAYSSQHKNITVTIKVANRETKPIKCYRLKKGAADIQDLAVNDTITVTGTITNYNGTIEFTNGCVLDAYVKGEVSTTVKVPEMVTDLKTDTAYKLYVEQEGVGKTLYFAGKAISEDYPFYMSTTEDADLATDVYLQQADGGYYLYFYNGTAKSYLDMYKDDTHYSIKITDQPGLVYTYDTQYNTLKTYVEDSDAYMGSNGTYTSISGSAYSYVSSSTSYPAHLGVIVEKELDESDLNLAPQVTEQPKDGDIVIIYYNGKAMSSSASGNKMATVTGAMLGEKLSVTNAMAQLTVHTTAEGYYTFTMGGKYMTSGATGYDLTFESAATDYSLWTVEAAPDNTWYIVNVNAEYQGYKQGIQVYDNMFSTFSVKDSNKNYYQMQLFQGTEESNTGSGSTGDTAQTPEMVTSPEAEKAYKLYVDKGGKILYFTGSAMSDSTPWYMGTTEDPAEAADVYLEAVSGGYYLYVRNGSAKTYLDMYKNDTHYSLQLVSAPGIVYSFDTADNVLKATVVDEECYIGSQGTYSSISCNKYSEMDDTSYFCHLGVMTEGSDSGNTGGDEGSNLDPNDLEALLEAAAKLENGEYLDVETSQTGVITMIPVYNASYGSYTFSMDVDGISVYCYSINFAEGIVPEKGDTVTITGKLTAFNGGPQFDHTSTAVWVKAGEEQDAGVVYNFQSSTDGKQYAFNEVHKLDDIVTVITNDAHFKTTEIRLYDSPNAETNAHDSTAVIQSSKLFNKIVLAVGNKTGTLQISVSADGENWSTLEDVTITSKNYTEYTVNIPEGTKYLKMDSTGETQLRVQYFILTFAE